MNVIDAIEQRRATHQFDPEHPVPEADLNTILAAGRRAPTAFNLQHTRFLVVRDPELRAKIRAVSWDQAQVTDAGALIIVCADVMAWRKDPARYWRNAPVPVREKLVPAIGGFYEGNPQMQRDEALRSAGMASMNLMLAAQALGYNTCPMDGFNFEAVAELIHLPDDHLITMFVTVGKSLDPPKPRAGDLEPSEQILFDTFSPLVQA